MGNLFYKINMNGHMDKEGDWSRKYRHFDRSGEIF